MDNQLTVGQVLLLSHAAANESIFWNQDYNSRKDAALKRVATKVQLPIEIVQSMIYQVQRKFLSEIPPENKVQQNESILSDTEAQAEANPGPDGQVHDKLPKIIEEGMKKADSPTWPTLLGSYVTMMIQNAGDRPEAEMRRLQKTLIGVMENFQDGEIVAP